VFKTVTTAAALQDGLLHPDEKIRCNGSYNQYIGYRLRCTGVHRDINVFKGLARSCNVFYAELGRRLGGERILHYAEKLGANTKTGIEISEKNTPVLDIENSNKYKSGASQAAIGQGGITVSMLQLARITASIALGRSLTSRLVQKVINYSRDEDIKNFKSESSEIGISEENIVHVRNAMREVVLSGLATDFRNYPVKVAAKTGTAQNSSGDDHTTFICYAPFEKPEIAIAVIIANGKHGKNSKNVARKIMNAYFNL
ncbi:MAG: penicillin-binding transpeptidase domain-containing protein, partial [Firmicutes bacterium]|nr:penicillin-binding transpeptidase domain-containing protein [Bacillota bacterium]